MPDQVRHDKRRNGKKGGRINKENVAWDGKDGYNLAIMQAGSGEVSGKEIKSFLERELTGADGNLIGVLQETQKRFGYLPAEALEQTAKRMRVPLSRIYGVVSFYAQFYMEPRGQHTILCCRGTACHVKGANKILEAIKRTLKIDEGESTPDLKFYLETVACLGTCFLAPVIMIDEEYFGKLTSQKVQTILENYPD